MTTENIQINIREDGSRLVVVNIQAIANASANAGRQVDFLRSSFQRLAIGYMIKEFVEMADAVNLLEARLRMATKTTENFARAQEDLYRISQTNNVGLKETTQLYVKMMEPIQKLGGGVNEVSGIIDAFSTAMRISGASTKEMSAATLQFSQAMNKGKLDGDEFRTMAEVAPRVLRAMADGMGVATGELKGMASQGKLTADVIGNALLSQLKQLKAEASGLQNTVGGAFSDLTNDTMITVGAFDKLTGTSKMMADVIQGVSFIVFELGKVFKQELADGSKVTTDQFSAMTPIIFILGKALETILLLGSDISFVFQGVGREIGGIAAQVTALVNRDWKGVKAIRKEMIEDGRAALAELERYQGRVAGMTERALADRERMKNGENNPQYDPFKGLKVEPSEKDLLDTRMRLAGITKTYFKDLNALQAAYEAGKMGQKEYVELMSELAKKTWDASEAGKSQRHAVKENDDRLKVMQDGLVKQETVFDRERSIYESRGQMLDLYHQKFNTSDAEYYSGREAARAEFIASEAISYAKERSLLESFKPKNDRESADQQLRLDRLLRQHEDFNNQMASLRTNDELSQIATNKAIQENSDDTMNNYLSGLNITLKTLQDTTKARELSKSAIERENVAMLQQALANMRLQATEPETDLHTSADIEQAKKFVKFLEDELKVRQGISAELSKQEAFTRDQKNFDRQIKQWRDFGNDIAESMSQAFGKTGDAIGGFFKSFSDGVARQYEIMKQLRESTKGLEEDDPQRIAAVKQAREASGRAQVKSFGDMADAAKGFFSEQSRGYKIMDATAKVSHALQLAMNMQSMISGMAAGAAQMFAQSGWGGFAGVAAMGVVMAGLGYSIMTSHDDGGMSAEEVQKQQGAGSVFGDASAKSESISRSIDKLEEHSSELVPLTQSMLASLHNIEANMSGLANLVLRTDGLKDGTNLGIQTGTLSRTGDAGISSFLLGTNAKGGAAGGAALGFMLGGPIGAVLGGIGGAIVGKIASLWGKTTQEIKDSGLQFGGKVSDLQDGRGFAQYASIDTTKSSWFGLSKDTSNRVETQGLNSELSQQFGLIFDNLEVTLKTAAGSLGKDGEAVGKAIENMNIDPTKVSLKGLTGDALTQAISTMISKTMDQIAQTAFPGLDDFRQVGEGYAETVVRVAGGIEYATVTLDQLGIAAVKYSDIVNKQGDVATEIIRQSVLASSDLGGGIKSLVATMSGSADDLVKAYTSLIEVRQLLNNAGLDGNNLSRDTIIGAGGLDNLKNGAEAYFENFFSEAEQNAAKLSNLNGEFSKLGVATPATRDAFRALVIKFDDGTEAGNRMVGKLMALAGSFADAVEATDAYGQSLDNVKAKQTMLAKITNMTASKSDALQVQRDSELKAMDRALWTGQRYIYALEDLQTARDQLQASYDAEKSNLDDLIDKYTEIGKALRETVEGMMLGDKSILSPEDKYGEAKRQFDEVYSLAKSGDPDAMMKMQDVANTFLSASRDYYASSEGYTTDFDYVKKALLNTAGLADSQVDIAKQQLATLNQMASGILELNSGIMSFASALAAYQSALVNVANAKSNYDNSQSSDPITRLYNDILGRAPDQGGYQFWQNALNSGVSLDHIRDEFQISPEAMGLKAWTARALGGYTPPGLTLVGEEGPEFITTHTPSYVYTAGETAAMMAGRSKGDTSGLEESLDGLVTASRAAITQQGAIATATLAKLDAVAEVLELVRKAIKENA